MGLTGGGIGRARAQLGGRHVTCFKFHALLCSGLWLSQGKASMLDFNQESAHRKKKGRIASHPLPGVVPSRTSNRRIIQAQSPEPMLRNAYV